MYVNCARGPALLSFAQLFPNAAIVAADINPYILQKAEGFLRGSLETGMLDDRIRSEHETALYRSALKKNAIHPITNVSFAPPESCEHLVSQESDTYDVVFSHEPIWSVPHVALFELCRVVKGNGLLITTSYAHRIATHRLGKTYCSEVLEQVYGASTTRGVTKDGDFYKTVTLITPEIKAMMEIDKVVLEVINAVLRGVKLISTNKSDSIYEYDFPTDPAKMSMIYEALHSLVPDNEALQLSLQRLHGLTLFSDERIYIKIV